MQNVFDLLHSKVRDLAKSRFENPTEVQRLAIPKVLEGKNVLAISGTGLGKSEACLLPIFSKLIEKEHKPLAVLYITPMKALNRDMFERLIWWCNKLDLDISIRHGDTTQHERKLQTEHPPHILITTPEQIQAMLTGKNLRKLLSNIKYIIVDELHELVESKRGVQLTVGLERLKQLCGKPEIIALSATIGSPELAAEFIGCDEIVKAVDVKGMNLSVESPFSSAKDKQIAQKIFIGDSVAARLRTIYELMQQYNSVLTFTNTREAAEVLSSRLRALDKNFPHEVHHSSLSKEVRIRAERDFKDEKLKSLICTSSLELGIDIGAIDIILQYCSPRQVTKLIQRAGRSGHSIGRISKGVIIAADGDDIFESAVIAKRALAGQLEPLKAYRNCLDVLAHQIIGLAMENYKIDQEKAYEIIKSAKPFQSLSKKDFLDILKLLEQLKFIFIDKEIGRKRRAFDYYFQNLSTIPDSLSFKVIDSASNAAVGSLDEGFIATHGDVGSSFIVRGRPWRILSVEDRKVFVESVDELESAIPAWEGELIPVPFEVAQEVGKLRAEIAELINNLKNKEIAEALKQRYPLSSEAAVKIISLIKRQIKKHPLPDGKTLLLERFNEYIVMHTLFGTLVNETLAKFISAILSAQYGEAILSKADPYRIIFRGCGIDDIKKVLFEHPPEDLEIILEKTLPRSSLFKYRFIQVAKRFGAIEKGASFDKINIDRLIDVFWSSPIFKETLNEIFTEKIDLQKTKEILAKIQTKEIAVCEATGLSPLAKLGFRHELYDVVKSERPEKEILKLFTQRILNTKVRLICINCGKYSIATIVNDIEPKPTCPLCESRLIGMVRPYQTESQKIVKKWLEDKELKIDEQRLLDGVKKTANLLIDYGKQACIVLAGRGVGPQTAIRILAKKCKTEDDLFRYILAAEKEFIKNKKYWN